MGEGNDFQANLPEGIQKALNYGCAGREKIDWQEARKFDSRLVRTIFIFCCPSSKVSLLDRVHC